jgi:hypothetical protein
MKVLLSVVCDRCGRASIDVPFEVLLEGRMRISKRGEEMLRMIEWKTDLVDPNPIYQIKVYSERQYWCPECARKT